MDTPDGTVWLSADELGTLIESDPGWQGQDVRLFSCETGATPIDGTDPYGQQLADRLGVPVEHQTSLAGPSKGLPRTIPPETGGRRVGYGRLTN